MPDKLGEYRRKRHFGTTTEPRGGEQSPPERSSARFVIQKHEAGTLHYDFRIEVDGVLKSWAIPKGPSLNPQDKRLAVPTEDHPLEYGDFEGIIPQGEYGAGTVLVWDTGSYQHLTEQQTSAAEALENGHINLWLDGDKLRGGYALTRMGKRTDSQWLLIKMKDAGADRRRNPLERQPRSVLSGNDLRGIAQHGQELR
ncbi:DNA polymerase ligase N-terminal domain-containing protein [Haloactinomyces albus]|uniref:DNA ligase D-like protein (Predicted 3'-phosphoesterase) n=1 Tax=Haloactinomyces albus TaxID=1352928 RepID=A0AAE3ZG22_9ACTN|nr:DNA polymerase ligase N-terminal domain-containing protein [Haloactinomyces albus]MDR7304281.1 DNA ligase D-like protein (predicted 3'-phosphoesterase) [Haloactinomyces albus]